MECNTFAALKQNSVSERDGILVDRLIADKTVWDKLATENPTHAVISANDEAAAEAKSLTQIAELKSDLRDGVVLDLGCGYGRVAQYLLPQRSFSHYVGIDSAFNMVTLFRERYQNTESEQGTPATFINADIHTIPLQDNSVDNVIVAAVFLHNHKSVARRSVEEVYRVLKPGGKVFVYSSFPYKWSLMGLQGGIYQAVLNLMGNPFKNGPVRYYGRKEAAQLFENFGDVVVRPTGFAIVPKRIIFLPKTLDMVYRDYFAEPINRTLQFLGTNTFPTHTDVFATK